MKTLRAMFALALINMTFETRPLYSGLANFCYARAYVGVNPLLVLMDGCAWTLFAAVLLFGAVLFVVWMPLHILLCLVWPPRRAEVRQVRELIAKGRMDWTYGRILDPLPEADHGQEG